VRKVDVGRRERDARGSVLIGCERNHGPSGLHDLLDRPGVTIREIDIRRVRSDIPDAAEHCQIPRIATRFSWVTANNRPLLCSGVMSVLRLAWTWMAPLLAATMLACAPHDGAEERAAGRRAEDANRGPVAPEDEEALDRLAQTFRFRASKKKRRSRR